MREVELPGLTTAPFQDKCPALPENVGFILNKPGRYFSSAVAVPFHFLINEVSHLMKFTAK